MNITDPQLTAPMPEPKRRWYQWSQRILLVFVAICALLGIWVAAKIEQGRREREAVVAIQGLGGRVLYDWQEHDEDGNPLAHCKMPGPTWLRRMLGNDVFQHVTHVDLHGSQVTDVGLAHLTALIRLNFLWLDNTKITDSGLEHLKDLSQLKDLYIEDTKVADAGLKYLQGLKRLQSLGLSDTQVTDTGLENLKGMNRLARLFLDGTRVTDAGLEHLEGLKELQYLGLSRTQVTDEGVRSLCEHQPVKHLVIERRTWTKKR